MSKVTACCMRHLAGRTQGAPRASTMNSNSAHTARTLQARRSVLSDLRRSNEVQSVHNDRTAATDLFACGVVRVGLGPTCSVRLPAAPHSAGPAMWDCGFEGSPATHNGLLVPPGVCGFWPLLTVWDPRFPGITNPQHTAVNTATLCSQQQ